MPIGSFAYHLGGLSVTVERYRDGLLSLLPPGRAFLRSASTPVVMLLEGLAQELARVGQRLDDLVAEELPSETVENLSEWETALGLPDPNITVTGTADRQAMVAGRLLDSTGHALEDIVAIAHSMGYATPVVTRYQPFRVGRSSVGDRLTNAGWSHALVMTFDEGTLDRGLEGAIERVRREHATFTYVFTPGGVPTTLVTVDGYPLTVDGEAVTVSP